MDSLSVPLTSRVQDLAAPNLSASSLKHARNMAQAQKAAMDFESVYLAQMLQPMFDTVDVDETFGGGSAEETWRGLQVEEVAKHMARNGGIGLADVVAKEMMRLQEVADGNPRS